MSDYTKKQMEYINSVDGDAHNSAVTIIGELEAELAKYELISVEDRLPKKGYLVRLYQSKPISRELKGMLDLLNGDVQFIDEGLHCVDNITHWHPIILPEAKKEGEFGKDKK
jgi:hypothetical protein